MRTLTTRMTVVAAVVASLTGMAARAATPAPKCAVAHAGGDWPSYGHDARNTRTQDAEHVIGTGNVGNLTMVWNFAATDAAGSGSISSTPVVADGCVFVTSSVGGGGRVFALNADDGSLVWATKTYPGTARTGVGGAMVGSPAVAKGRVFANVSGTDHPYTVALDELTGTELWRTTVDKGKSAFINASPLVVRDMVVVGISGYEADDGVRGAYAVLDAATGSMLVHRFTISDADFAAGQWGASAWGTPAADVDGGWLYVPTGNPSSRKPPVAANADSLLKVDLRDPKSATFGSIVGVYHGQKDQYVDGADQQPACQTQPDVKYVSWSATCLQLDLDFGASPNLWRDATGRLMLGDLQKSGVYHAADANTMAPAWQMPMGLPGPTNNAASPAMDGSAIYAEGTPGGAMFSLSPAGQPRWVAPVADVIHYQSVSAANGVVYTVDGYGFLDAWDAATGVPVLKHNMAADLGQSAVNQPGSNGVAIARNSVFAAVNQFVVAYTPGAAPPVPVPPPPGPPPVPGGGSSPLVYATGPGSAFVGWTVPAFVIPHGSQLTFVNVDAASHNFVSPAGLFQSRLIGLGGQASVDGIDKLGPGNYSYICTLHAPMKGTLVVL